MIPRLRWDQLGRIAVFKASVIWCSVNYVTVIVCVRFSEIFITTFLGADAVVRRSSVEKTVL